MNASRYAATVRGVPLLLDAIYDPWPTPLARSVSAAGGPGERLHLVGHDWGGHVSWVTAHRHPARIRSLAILSRPHPAAFRRAFRENADEQRHRSRHHKIFHDPTTGPRLLEDGARRDLLDEFETFEAGARAEEGVDLALYREGAAAINVNPRWFWEGPDA